MQRWQWCQAIENAGGLLPADWLWLSQARSEYPTDCALILGAGCGHPDQLSAQLPGRPLRLLSHPLTPQQRCQTYPCPLPEGQWVLLVGTAAGPNLWEQRPLYGQRIAITREASQAITLQQRLQELGAEVVSCPVLEFVAPDDPAPLDTALQQLPGYQWLLFTSPNGVNTFFKALKTQSDARKLGHMHIGVIGPGTAAALEQQGLRADLIPTKSIAEGLLEALSAYPMQGQKVLLPRAQEARTVLPEELTRRGATVDVVPCYKTIMPLSIPQPGLIDRVILMSSSAARNFRQIYPGDPECICIGPVTAATARLQGFKRIIQAEQYDQDGIIRALLNAS